MGLKLEDYRYDADKCTGCKGCVWVDHIYMSGVDFSTRCPSLTRYLFDAYAAYGREQIALALLDGELAYSPQVLDVIYKCNLCGACDAGCKRNLDLEPLTVLETLRLKVVQDGYGPLPEHKRVAENIRKTKNYYGADSDRRSEWMEREEEIQKEASVIYFVGCNSSFVEKGIARATAKILKAMGVSFMTLPGGEWCCGYPLYSTGQEEEAKKVMEHNLEAIYSCGAKTVLTGCAECYKTWKVDYPKILNKSSSDMGFTVMHLAEYTAPRLKEGSLKPINSIEMKAAYHDPCNLGRLSEPWIHWVGKKGKYGVNIPPKEIRRSTNGIYQQPREILASIPGLELVEMKRMRENAWCCGSGGGVRDQFPDFARWSALERWREAEEAGAEAIITACPWCKENLLSALDTAKDRFKVYDLSEIVAKSI